MNDQLILGELFFLNDDDDDADFKKNKNLSGIQFSFIRRFNKSVKRKHKKRDSFFRTIPIIFFINFYYGPTATVIQFEPL